MLSSPDRRQFDDYLEEAIASLPEHLQRLLEEIPLIVEDRPSPALSAEMKLEDRGVDLCGLHWGIPLTRRSVQHSGVIPDQMMLFREPIIRLARYEGKGAGRQAELDSLRRQVRITLLHEIGHHFGMDEDDLTKLGYG